MYFVHYSITRGDLYCQAGPFQTHYVAEQFALALAQNQALTGCEINKENRRK